MAVIRFHCYLFRAKLTLANKHGETALDVARNWGDDFIYAIVYEKAAGIPTPAEPKGCGSISL